MGSPCSIRRSRSAVGRGGTSCTVLIWWRRRCREATRSAGARSRSPAASSARGRLGGRAARLRLLAGRVAVVGQWVGGAVDRLVVRTLASVGLSTRRDTSRSWSSRSAHSCCYPASEAGKPGISTMTTGQIVAIVILVVLVVAAVAALLLFRRRSTAQRQIDATRYREEAASRAASADRLAAEAAGARRAGPPRAGTGRRAGRDGPPRPRAGREAHRAGREARSRITR